MNLFRGNGPIWHGRAESKVVLAIAGALLGATAGLATGPVQAAGRDGRTACCNNVPVYAASLRDSLWLACVDPEEKAARRRTLTMAINAEVENLVTKLRKADGRPSDGCSSHGGTRRLNEDSMGSACPLAWERFKNTSGCAPARVASRELLAAFTTFVQEHDCAYSGFESLPSMLPACYGATTATPAIESGGGSEVKPSPNTALPPPATEDTKKSATNTGPKKKVTDNVELEPAPSDLEKAKRAAEDAQARLEDEERRRKDAEADARIAKADANAARDEAKRQRALRKQAEDRAATDLEKSRAKWQRDQLGPCAVVKDLLGESAWKERKALIATAKTSIARDADAADALATFRSNACGRKKIGKRNQACKKLAKAVGSGKQRKTLRNMCRTQPRCFRRLAAPGRCQRG